MKKLLIITLLLIFPAAAFAVIADIGLDPLDQSTGARPMSLGTAFSAYNGDANTLFFNPAGLANSRGIAVSLGSMKNMSFGAVYDTGAGNVGLGIVYKEATEFEIADLEDKPTYEHNQFVLGYGVGNKDMSFGFTYKGLITQRLKVPQTPDVTSIAVNDIDVGYQWMPLDYATLGIVLHNALSSPYTVSGTEENLPRSTRIGLKLGMLGEKGIFFNDAFGADLSFDTEQVNLEDRMKNNSYYGLELSFYKWLFVRVGGGSVGKVGTKEETASISSFGLGMKFSDTEFSLCSAQDQNTQSPITFVSITYSPPHFVFSPVVKIEAPKEQVKSYAGMKLLAVSAPEDNFVTYTDTVIVSGEARPGASLTINGVNVYISDDGKFNAVQSLTAGKNLLDISAKSGAEVMSESRRVLKKAKVTIAEEEDINKKIAKDVVEQEQALKEQEEKLKQDKEKGTDVAEGEKKLQEDKLNVESRKIELYSEKKKLEERKEKVETLVTLGVIEVSPEKNFEIEAPIKRGEMITWLVKAAGLEIPKVDKPVFTDVPVNHPSAPYVKAAKDKGLIKGDSKGRFRPDDAVSEEEGQFFFKAFGVIK
jgi:hypothetical protein